MRERFGGVGPVLRAACAATGAAVTVLAVGISAGAVAEASPPDSQRGHQLYEEICAACHGLRGEGATGPSLKDLHARRDFAATVTWLKDPSPRMPKLYPISIDDQDVQDVAAYVQGF